MTFQEKFMRVVVGVNLSIFSYILMLLLSLIVGILSNQSLLKMDSNSLTTNPLDFWLLATLPMLFALIIFPLWYERKFAKKTFQELGFNVLKGNKFIELLTYTVSIGLIVYTFYNHYSVAYTVFVHYFISGLGEEILFRGILQRRMMDFLKPYISIIIASLIFAFAFHQSGTFLDNLIIRFPLGLVFGGVYYKTRSILPAFALHLAYNFFISF